MAGVRSTAGQGARRGEEALHGERPARGMQRKLT